MVFLQACGSSSVGLGEILIMQVHGQVDAAVCTMWCWTGRDISAGVNSLQSEADLSSLLVREPCHTSVSTACSACDDFGCFQLWTTQAPQMQVQDKVSCFF